MAQNEEQPQNQQQKGPSAIGIWVYNKGISVWNGSIGRMIPRAMLSYKTRGGTEQETIAFQQYQDLIRLNNAKIGILNEIEGNWAIIEEGLLGKEEFRYEEEPKSNVFSDRYRKIEYFRDPEMTQEEVSIFKERGTIKLEGKPSKIKFEDVLAAAERIKNELETKGLRNLDDKEKEMLEKANKILANQEMYRGSLSRLPMIVVNKEKAIFINGREEGIVAFGPIMGEIVGHFSRLAEGIDVLASSSRVGPTPRGRVTTLLNTLAKTLEEVDKKAQEHGDRVSQIHTTLNDLITIATSGTLKGLRPKIAWIRFSHTYKIIKKYRKDKDTNRIIRFEEEHPNFNMADELAPGLDENGRELEIFEMPENSDNWYVLLDKWWVEISENAWQVKTILGKNGGKEVLRDKVVNGVKREKHPYTRTYRSGYIRKVPKEYVGDVDPLDKMSFISNEFDAYRDDFRDGRYHPHSKSSMDYIIVSNPVVEDVIKEKESIMPEKPINFDIKTEDPEVRIKFRPIYYTSSDTGDKKKHGEVNPRGGLGRITMDNIPDDERRVTRRYEMETEVLVDDSTGDKVLRNQVRKPTHLNPAFDRAAIYHTYIHWGRMYYYETTDGINRWSENPFPHVTTRGFAKYLINLVLKKSFSFDDAVEALRNGEWDFGVRHYGQPFIKNPLGPAEGPEGVLSHATTVAKKKGWI